MAEQLELDFGEDQMHVTEEPWTGYEFILEEQGKVLVNKAFPGWEYLVNELVRWEIAFAVVPSFDLSMTELYYSKEHEAEFTDILNRAYSIKERAHG